MFQYLENGKIYVQRYYDIRPVSSVRDLGVYLDADVAMKSHVTAVARSCFAALRRIRSVRRSLPRHALLTLIRALVISKVDYCCFFLTGISVTNSADYSLFWTLRRDWFSRQGGQTTQLHCSVNSIGFESRIGSSSSCVCCHTTVFGTARSYLADSLRGCADTEGHRRLRSSVTDTLNPIQFSTHCPRTMYWQQHEHVGVINDVLTSVVTFSLWHRLICFDAVLRKTKVSVQYDSVSESAVVITSHKCEVILFPQ